MSCIMIHLFCYVDEPMMGVERRYVDEPMMVLREEVEKMVRNKKQKEEILAGDN